MLLKPKLWFQLKTFPIMIFTIFDFIGAYLLPANSILLMRGIWGPAVEVVSDYFGMDVSAEQVIFWYAMLFCSVNFGRWVLFQLVVISTTTLQSSDLFYALSAFFSSCMMAFSLIWLVYSVNCH
jgi:hypothetical protein